MLRKLYQIVRKEIKLIIRAKTSSLVMIFGPLVLIILIGLAFAGSGLTGIKIGLYSEADKTTTDYIFSKLQKSPTMAKQAGDDFKIYNTNSKDDCINAVQNGKYHICMHVMQNKVNNQTVVNLYADFSKMELAWLIIRTITTKVEETSDSISYNITANLLSGLRDASLQVSENTYLLDSMGEEGMQMQARLENIKSEISSFSMDPNISTKDVDSYLVMIDSNKQKLEDLGQTTQSASQLSQEKISQISNVLNTIDASIADVKTALTDFTVEAEKRVEELKVAQAQLEQKVTSPEYQAQATPAENEAALNSIYALEQQIQATQDVVHQAQVMLNQTTPIEKTFSDVSLKVDEANKTIAGKINDLEKMRLSAMSDLNNVEKKLNDAKDKLNSTMKKIDDAKKMQSDLDKTFGEVNVSLAKSLANLKTFGDQSKKFGGELYKIAGLDPETLINPVYVRVKPLSAVSSKVIYLFPTLVALIVMFVSIMLASTLVINEKKASASFRNFITPNQDHLFIIGTFISALLIVMFQAVIMVMVGVLMFRIPTSTLPFVFLAVAIAASVFILIGMIVGYVFRSSETGTMFSIGSIILMMSYSPVFVPLEAMPKFASFAAQYNPFTIIEGTLKILMIKNFGFASIKLNLLILAIGIAILSFFAWRAEKASKNRFS